MLGHYPDATADEIIFLTCTSVDFAPNVMIDNIMSVIVFLQYICSVSKLVSNSVQYIAGLKFYVTPA